MSDILYTETITNTLEMKNNVQWWHLVVAILAVILSTFGIVSMYASKLEEGASKTATVTENHEQRIKQLESDRAETRSDIKEIKSMQIQTLLILKDKQDRK